MIFLPLTLHRTQNSGWPKPPKAGTGHRNKPPLFAAATREVRFSLGLLDSLLLCTSYISFSKTVAMSTTSTLVNALVGPSEASALITTLLYGVYLGMNYLYFTSDRSPSWPRRITFAINFILLTILVSFVFAANYIRDVKWYGNPIVLLTPDIAFKVCLLQRPSSWTVTQ